MRLATFNILNSRTPADRLVDPGRLGDAVRALDPDILALQEVDRDQPRSHGVDLTAVAAEAMGAVSHRFVATLVGTPGRTWLVATEDDLPGAASYGIALLTRFPAADWRVLGLSRLRPWFPLPLGARRGSIMVREEPRSALLARIETPLGAISVVATHLSFLPGWGRLQLGQVRRQLAQLAGPAVIMGDLNIGGSAPAKMIGYRSLATHRTYPRDRPVRQLDHILARGQLGVARGSGAVELAVSDHRALWVDIGPEVSPTSSGGTD